MIRFQRSIVFVLIAGLLTANLPLRGFAQQQVQAVQAKPVNPATTDKAQQQQQNQPENPAQNPTQNPPGQTPTAAPPAQDPVRINTQLVQVDAVVTDKKGKHVEDLTQADFELTVDGKKQALTHFSHVNLPTLVKRDYAPKKKNDGPPPPETMPTRQIDPAEIHRTMAFIVDDLGLSFKSTEFVRETMRKFVAEQMQEGDMVAIIRTGNGLGMLEQFTSDKRILFSAIEKLTWNPLSRDMNPTFSDAGGDAPTDDQTDKQAVLDQFDEFRDTSFTTGTLGAIAFVVQALRALPGRKSVVLLSDGFRINSKNNDDNTSELILQQLQGVAEVARRASVVVYSIDAKGLAPYTPGGDVGGKPSANQYSDAIDSAQAALEGPVFLSNLTGGFTVTNTNDLNIGIQEALYDQQSYYSLGFDPDDEKFDRKFHKIKIRALRPGLNVRTNGGFFGEKEVVEPEKPRTRGQQILAALLSPLGKRDLSLRMTPYFFNASKEGPLVRALFHIDCSKLTFKDTPNGKKALNLDLAAFAFDEKGATVDMTANRINIEFNEQQYQQVMANGLAYRKDFPLKKSGAYQLRAVLRDDASGQAGTASQFIQVPDLSKGKLGMSGLVLTAPKLPAAAAAKADNTNSATVTTAVDKPAGESPQNSALPTSPYVRKFARTSWIQFGAAIYNATTDKKNPQPQITVRAEIYHDGKPVYQMPSRLLEVTPGTNPKRFDYVSQLRLNNFPEGDYLLHLIVTDGLAKKKFARTEQWMDFSVR